MGTNVDSLLAAAKSYLDDVEGMTPRLERVCDDNPYIGENAFKREVVPIFNNAREAIERAMHELTERDDFAEVEKAWGLLCFQEARLYTQMAGALSKYAGLPDNSSDREKVAEYNRRSQDSDLDSLLMFRDSSSLFNVALGEYDYRRTSHALALLAEIERSWPGTPSAVDATKKRLEFERRQPGTRPEPLGMPRGGALFKDLCRRFPAYGKSRAVAMRQVNRALSGEDPEYLNAVFDHYESSSGVPGDLIADLYENAFQELAEWQGAKAAVDRVIAASRRVEGAARARLGKLVEESLLARLEAAASNQMQQVLQTVLDVVPLRNDVQERLALWFNTACDAGDPEVMQAGVMLHAAMPPATGNRVLASLRKLGMSTLHAKGRRNEWQRVVSLLLDVGKTDDSTATSLVEWFRDQTGKLEGAADESLLSVGETLAAALRHAGAPGTETRQITRNLLSRNLDLCNTPTATPLIARLKGLCGEDESVNQEVVDWFRRRAETDKDAGGVAKVGEWLCKNLGDNQRVPAVRELTHTILLRCLRRDGPKDDSDTLLASLANLAPRTTVVEDAVASWFDQWDPSDPAPDAAATATGEWLVTWLGAASAERVRTRTKDRLVALGQSARNASERIGVAERLVALFPQDATFAAQLELARKQRLMFRLKVAGAAIVAIGLLTGLLALIR